MEDRLNFDQKSVFVSNFFEQARRTFLRDGVHALILILFADYEYVDAMLVDAEERHDVVSELASSMSDRPFDTIIMISENWTAPIEISELGLMPSESDRRFETLDVWGAFADGTSISITALIDRDQENCSLGEPQVSTQTKFNLLEPILERWRASRQMLQ